jgi:tetratricopeptide (TPR) repeat protein
LAQYRRELPPEADPGDGYRANLRAAEAAISLAEGNPGEAIRLFGEAREAVPDCKLCFLPELGEAYEAANLPDSAATAYQEYLEADALFRSQADNRYLHRALLGLGRAYEALGRPQDALASYRRVLSLWTEADPGLQGRVGELRGKVQALVEASS